MSQAENASRRLTVYTDASARGGAEQSVANLIATLEPVFTAIIAYILLGERLSGIQIIGSLLILGGVVFLRIYEGWLAGQALPEPLPL